MTRVSRCTRYGALITIGLLALAIAPSAMAQEPKGKWGQETKGVSIQSKSILPLKAQIPGLKGYALRMRTIVLEPGAVVGYHSHANRPVVVYLVSGEEYTEHRDGQAEIVRKPGEQWVEGADVAHWSENRGTEITYLIVGEVVASEQ